MEHHNYLYDKYTRDKLRCVICYEDYSVHDRGLADMCRDCNEVLKEERMKATDGEIIEEMSHRYEK